MNCSDENRSCGCIADVLERILQLQNDDYENENFAGCDKPYLGPTCTTICYNTRPIMLFNCCTGTNWSFPYTLNGVENNSIVFRVEAVDECCCTCRILAFNEAENRYVNTNEFFTIDLNCVGAIKCLQDTFVEVC